MARKEEPAVKFQVRRATYFGLVDIVVVVVFILLMN